MLEAASIRARTLLRIAMPVALDEALEARRAFRGRGLHVPSLRICRQAWLSRLHLLPPDLDLEDGLVVDIGANEGNFTASLKALAPNATVVAVEPAPEPRARFEARLAGVAGITVVPKAVADRPGTATFHITRHDHNSSLHAPRPETAALYDDPGWQVAQDLSVEVTTLDELTAGSPVAVIKLDVQGGELDVLRGGTETLQRTRAVLMEVTFLSHYADDATFDRLHAEMANRGFSLADMSEPSRTAEGRATWADACYVRS